jgi:hypothetical protein
VGWIKERLKERTSWDGILLFGVSLVALIATPLIKYAAIVGVIYGGWTFWKSEK